MYNNFKPKQPPEMEPSVVKLKMILYLTEKHFPRTCGDVMRLILPDLSSLQSYNLQHIPL